MKITDILPQKKNPKRVSVYQKNRLLDRALLFLAFRPRSEKELRDHFLKKKPLSQESSEEENVYERSLEDVIDHLKKQNYLNDLEFAKWWLQQRNQFSPRGNRLVALELRQKGINPEILNALISNFDQSGLARRAAEKKLTVWGKLPYPEFKQKMGQYLLRRGFNWSTASSVIDSLKKKK